MINKNIVLNTPISFFFFLSFHQDRANQSHRTSPLFFFLHHPHGRVTPSPLFTLAFSTTILIQLWHVPFYLPPLSLLNWRERSQGRWFAHCPSTLPPFFSAGGPAGCRELLILPPFSPLTQPPIKEPLRVFSFHLEILAGPDPISVFLISMGFPPHALCKDDKWAWSFFPLCLSFWVEKGRPSVIARNEAGWRAPLPLFFFPTLDPGQVRGIHQHISFVPFSSLFSLPPEPPILRGLFIPHAGKEKHVSPHSFFKHPALRLPNSIYLPYPSRKIHHDFRVFLSSSPFFLLLTNFPKHIESVYLYLDAFLLVPLFQHCW